MTPLHQKIIELDRKKTEIKKFFEEYQTTLKELVKNHGVNHHFIDDQNIVYQLTELDGKWITFDKYGLDRTKRPGEDRGSLSVKKAQELGYQIK